MDNLKLGEHETLYQITKLEIPNEQVKNGKKHCWNWLKTFSIVIPFMGCIAILFLQLSQVKTLYILLYLIALLLFAAVLVHIDYQINTKKLAYKIEEAKALSALKRKLIEDIIIRDIKIKERERTLEIETAEKEKDKIKIEDKIERLKWLLSFNKSSIDTEAPNDATEKLIKEIEELIKTF